MKMKLNYIVVLVFLQLNLLAQVDKYHAVIPDVPSRPALVNDLGDLLTTEEENLLETKLVKFNKETSNEIAVVTVESAPEDVKEKAKDLNDKLKAKRAKAVVVATTPSPEEIEAQFERMREEEEAAGISDAAEI